MDLNDATVKQVFAARVTLGRDHVIVEKPRPAFSSLRIHHRINDHYGVTIDSGDRSIELVLTREDLQRFANALGALLADERPDSPPPPPPERRPS